MRGGLPSAHGEVTRYKSLLRRAGQGRGEGTVRHRRGSRDDEIAPRRRNRRRAPRAPSRRARKLRAAHVAARRATSVAPVRKMLTLLPTASACGRHGATTRPLHQPQQRHQAIGPARGRPAARPRALLPRAVEPPRGAGLPRHPPKSRPRPADAPGLGSRRARVRLWLARQFLAGLARGWAKYVPRAVWWGLEWSRYALSEVWHLDRRRRCCAATMSGDPSREGEHAAEAAAQAARTTAATCRPGSRSSSSRAITRRRCSTAKKDAYHEMLQNYVGAASSHAAPPTC